MSAEMIAHIERTRREASHPPHAPNPAIESAMELVEFLTKTFGNGMIGHAVSIGVAMPAELKPIPMLSSATSIIAPPKRGRGRPRKDAT